MTTNSPIIEIKHLKTYLGDAWVHQDINLQVKKGEILVIVGGSGTGKTVLLHEMLALRQPTSGSIRIFEHELTTANPETLLEIQRRWGVLFQQNALFSSLSVLENVSFPLNEHTDLDQKTIEQLALLKILLAGLPAESAVKYPSELSGGMQKRAALARSIALDPELLFLDEPTTGLDPNKVIAFDELILNLQSTMGLTIVMVTHDVDSLKRVANRVAFLGEGKVLAIEPPKQIMQNEHPLIQEFFNGPKNKGPK
ncbi:MAG TPA: ATP-binding cassette domain-containing protein [Gammaproteobacteria bacterium]|nr:ATP-binding cassette domain-containing protein [Gammaproteobacteria bacterium]